MITSTLSVTQLKSNLTLFGIEINNLFYKLYDLTPDEIKIIEGGLN